MTTRRPILVRTPSRLHFGLLGFGNPNARQFGGVGVMVNQPGIALQAKTSQSLRITGGFEDRIHDAAMRWAKSTNHEGELTCEFDVKQAPRLHAGLGVGTQLALAVATALNGLFDRECESPEHLARSVGRGLRSAVGTHGFAAGGLIAEQGKLPNESISSLIEHVALPPVWRFVLTTPMEQVGLHGEHEQSAFADLPPVPSTTTQELTAIMNDRIVPSAKAGDFAGFSDAVYDFGFIAGSCFESIQGSAYNGAALTKLVERLRAHGVRGVGQSSWGPTIFAISHSTEPMWEPVEDMRFEAWCSNSETVIATPNNVGATVTNEPAVQ